MGEDGTVTTNYSQGQRSRVGWGHNMLFGVFRATEAVLHEPARCKTAHVSFHFDLIEVYPRTCKHCEDG